jgi:hypothetical protein
VASASVSLESVRAAFHRLFIGSPTAGLRKEDEQKCLELVGILARLAKIQRGGRLVDAAAGKASVALVAAELLPIGQVTILERDPARIAACEAATKRLGRAVAVDLREVDLSTLAAWPDAPDAVVALHACGGAADLVIEGAVHSRARQVFLAPCCYGASIPFRARAAAVVAGLGFAPDDLLRRRMTASIVDIERSLRLEAAGYATEIEEFVAPTVTPHNLLFASRRTDSTVRIARARERLAILRKDAGEASAG